MHVTVVENKRVEVMRRRLGQDDEEEEEEEAGIDVVVVGSCNCDFLSYMEYLPAKGETVAGLKFKTQFGGKGANQCVAAADIGARTAMIAKVGQDSYGRDYIDRFKSKNINIEQLTESGHNNTGVAMVNIDKKGANTIVVIPGANKDLSVEDVRRADSMIKDCKILVCQLEVPAAVTRAALKAAHRYRVRTLLNPAPMPDMFDLSCLRYVDVLCLNETEIGKLCDYKVESIEDGKRACTLLTERVLREHSDGARMRVILTMGALGVIYTDYDCDTMHHVMGVNVISVDTTGAGDVFIGCLAAMMSRDCDYALSIRTANEIAALSVQYEGPQPLSHIVSLVS